MNSNKTALEKLLLVFMMLLTVCLFSWWGYQSVIYILSQMFAGQLEAPTDSSIFTVLVGVLGMVSGATVFAGSAFWWIGRLSAKTTIVYGSIGFMIKNVVDMVNDVAVFKVVHAGDLISVSEIKELAGILGSQLFQFVFWLFVAIYFTHLAKKKLMEIPKAA